MTFRLDLQCPTCATAGEPSQGSAAGLLGRHEAEGGLTCSKCRAEYRVVDGIPFLYVDDHEWRSKQRESEGWEALSAERGELHYEGLGAPPVDFVIPYIPHEPWATFGKTFDLLTEGMDLDGKQVLDIGAGRPWAAKHFALRGAHAAAMDINAHPVVGLGRGWEMAREAGVRVELLGGDSERIPVADASVDVTFISAAMHHTNFMRRLAREMARVLKPGGVALIANEPTRAAVEDEGDILLDVAKPELRHGITERRPMTSEYLTALSDAGLRVEALFLGPDCAEPKELRNRLQAQALIPPRQEWMRADARRRFAQAVRTRFKNWPAELALRRALPRNAEGARSSHAEMIALAYGRPDINIRATKPIEPST